MGLAIPTTANVSFSGGSCRQAKEAEEWYAEFWRQEASQHHPVPTPVLCLPRWVLLIKLRIKLPLLVMITTVIVIIV